MIKSLEVIGLNNHDEMKLEFEPDLNLLTGKNGSSKTTLLKLLWYLNGGQLLQLIREIKFQYADLITSNMRVIVNRNPKKETITITIDNEKPIILRDQYLRELVDIGRSSDKYIDTFLFDIRKKAIGAIFFPTFRRIEGGFSMGEGFYDPRYGRSTDRLKEAMQDLSARLSSSNQKFIASISTDDIVQLLTNEYASINEKVNQMQSAKSDSIIKKIKNRNKNEKDILNDIQANIEQMEADRKNSFQPFDTLSSLITNIFQHKGIQLNGSLTMGDVSNAISSDKLSAGEKQMLSFICYNTFIKEQTIFIDEPELSLHPDWQRTLIPTLLSQGSKNQFFMATHSPFIYSKYSDKEIMLSPDKGN